MPRSTSLLPILVVSFLVAGCARCGDASSSAPVADAGAVPVASGPADHVLVTDGPEGVRVWHGAGGVWTEFRRLPSSARSVRPSPGARHVAWVQDFVDAQGNGITKGFVWRDGREKADALGVMGFRKAEAMGFAVSDDGTAFFIDPEGTLRSSAPDGTVKAEGRGVEVLAGPGKRLAFAPTGGTCLETRPTPVHACGALLRPLAWDGDSLAYTAEHQLFVARGPDAVPYTSVREPTLAAVRDGRIAVVRGAEFENVTWDVVELVIGNGAPPKQLLRTAIVIGLAWDDDGQLLVLQRPQRASLYELLLAHAPAEFGGEAFPGEPARLDPATGTLVPADDLPTRRVRSWRPVGK